MIFNNIWKNLYKKINTTFKDFLPKTSYFQKEFNEKYFLNDFRQRFANKFLFYTERE